MATLAQLRDRTRSYLGVSASDKAFPNDWLDIWIGDAYKSLAADLPPDALVTRATLNADSPDGRIYTLSPSITNFRQMLALRVRSTSGSALRLVPHDQLETRGGPTYAITGMDATTVIETSPSVDAGETLYATYAAWPADLADQGSVPSAVPVQFHDVIALMAARTGFSSGDEGRFPDTLAMLLQDRYAQFVQYTGQRSIDPTLRRVVEVGSQS